MELIVNYLECCFVVGFVYIILARYSLTTKTSNEPALSSTLTRSAKFLSDLKKFLHKLNHQFKLADKFQNSVKAFEKSQKAEFKYLFYLVICNFQNNHTKLILK